MTDTGRQRSRTGTNDHRSASISDVARAAEVSIATVSRVINTPELVSPETTVKVRTAIEALGFRPNAFARGLMTRRSRIMGLSVPDLHGEFYSAILRAADAQARALGYHLLVSTETRGHNADDLYMPFGLVDGMALMITEPSERLLTKAQLSGVPIVLVDASPMDLKMDAVEIDNEPGTREATEHLIASSGAARCWFVGGPQTNYDTMERARTFTAVLTSRGVANAESRCAFGAYSLEWGRRWASDRASEGTLRNTGVLAGNDEIAWGVMLGSQQAGLRVPGDVRVVGFDDTRLCQMVQPTLSSVRVPLAELGTAAIELLASRIGNTEAPLESRTIKTSLVVRESSAG